MTRWWIGLVWAAAAMAQQVAWKDAMRQSKAWYSSAEAARIADNLLAYQLEAGGWDKNIDMSTPPGANPGPRQATIDNGATYTQMEFLARVHRATGQARFAAAFRRGFEYLLRAQYPNGGWPQFFPLRGPYYDHITYNDDAMVGVLELLRRVVKREPEYAFLNEKERARAQRAIEKGIDVILKTQVVQNGKLTVWCAQHDEHTLAPAKARAYELASLSGSESVGIVRFLMEIEHPSPEVVRAVKGAVEWFEAAKIRGIRYIAKPAPGTPKGFDRTVVEDPDASPLWARFYELGTNRPFFCGRDGVARYKVSEIEYERRNGYSWYVDRPAELLRDEYPRWLKLL